MALLRVRGVRIGNGMGIASLARLFFRFICYFLCVALPWQRLLFFKVFPFRRYTWDESRRFLFLIAFRVIAMISLSCSNYCCSRRRTCVITNVILHVCDIDNTGTLFQPSLRHITFTGKVYFPPGTLEICRGPNSLLGLTITKVSRRVLVVAILTRPIHSESTCPEN